MFHELLYSWSTISVCGSSPCFWQNCLSSPTLFFTYRKHAVVYVHFPFVLVHSFFPWTVAIRVQKTVFCEKLGGCLVPVPWRKPVKTGRFFLLKFWNFWFCRFEVRGIYYNQLGVFWYRRWFEISGSGFFFKWATKDCWLADSAVSSGYPADFGTLVAPYDRDSALQIHSPLSDCWWLLVLLAPIILEVIGNQSFVVN